MNISTFLRKVSVILIVFSSSLISPDLYACPEGWSCLPGKECPPFENCYNKSSPPLEKNDIAPTKDTPNTSRAEDKVTKTKNSDKHSSNRIKENRSTYQHQPDLPTADRLRRLSQSRAKDGLDYENVPYDYNTTRTRNPENISHQINHLGGMLASMACKNGQTRSLANSEKTVVWPKMASPKPPTISTSSDADHGHYKVDGADKMFEKLRKIKLPGPGGKVFKIGTWVGDVSSKAADKWAKQNKKKLVNLSVKIDLMKVELKCSAIELCVEGTWVAGGMAPIIGSEKRTVLKNPATYRPKVSIEGKHVPRHVRKALNKFKPLYQAYDSYKADPCKGSKKSKGKGKGKGGATNDGGTKTATTGDKLAARNCKPILDAIGALHKKQKIVNEQHVQAQLDVLDLESLVLKSKIAWINEKSAVEAKLKIADKELTNAKAALSRLLNNAKNSSNPNYADALKRASNRADTANTAVKTLNAQLKTIDSKFKTKISELEGKITKGKEIVATIKKQLVALRVEEDVLWDKYSDCISGR